MTEQEYQTYRILHEKFVQVQSQPSAIQPMKKKAKKKAAKKASGGVVSNQIKFYAFCIIVSLLLVRFIYIELPTPLPNTAPQTRVGNRR